MRFTLAILFMSLISCSSSYENGNGSSGGGGTISGVATLNVGVGVPGVNYSINGLSNPSIVLVHGQSYTFNVNSVGHPFWIKTVQGNTTANAYPNSGGLTTNGIETGTIVFAVPASGAPSTLYYDCQFHTPMTGTITIQ
jgi:hypothetical protein